MLSCSFIATAQLAEYLLQQQSGLSITHEWQKLGTDCLRRLLDMEESQLEALYAETQSIVSTAE